MQNKKLQHFLLKYYYLHFRKNCEKLKFKPWHPRVGVRKRCAFRVICISMDGVWFCLTEGNMERDRLVDSLKDGWNERESCTAPRAFPEAEGIVADRMALSRLSNMCSNKHFTSRLCLWKHSHWRKACMETQLNTQTKTQTGHARQDMTRKKAFYTTRAQMSLLQTHTRGLICQEAWRSQNSCQTHTYTNKVITEHPCHSGKGHRQVSAETKMEISDLFSPNLPFTTRWEPFIIARPNPLSNVPSVLNTFSSSSQDKKGNKKWGETFV